MGAYAQPTTLIRGLPDAGGRGELDDRLEEVVSDDDLLRDVGDPCRGSCSADRRAAQSTQLVEILDGLEPLGRRLNSERRVAPSGAAGYRSGCSRLDRESPNHTGDGPLTRGRCRVAGVIRPRPYDALVIRVNASRTATWPTLI